MAGANRVVIDGVSYPIDDATAVDFEEQQTLTDAQKVRARSNIGAASQDDMTSVQNAVGNVPSGSNLQDEVADLKSTFDKQYDETHFFYPNDFSWVRGAVNGGTGSSINSGVDAYVRAPQAAYSGTVKVINGMLGIYVFDENNTYLGWYTNDGSYRKENALSASVHLSGIVDFDSIIPAGGTARIVYRKENATETATSDGNANIIVCEPIKEKTEKIDDIEGEVQELQNRFGEIETETQTNFENIYSYIPKDRSDEYNRSAYIVLSSDTEIGSVVDLTPTSNSNMGYTIIDCIVGEYYIISGRSTSGMCGYFYIDTDGTLVEKGPTIYDIVYSPLVAGKLILNIRIDRAYGVMVGHSGDAYDNISKNKKAIDQLQVRQNFQNASHSDQATRPQAIRINHIRDQLYCGYISNTGEQGVMSYDFNTGAITRVNLRKTEADEHNQMAICNLSDNRIIAICTDHASTNWHYCYRSVRSEDISEWETIAQIPVPDGYNSTTYTQILRIGGKIYVFFRCKPNNASSSNAECWVYTSTSDNGDTWSTPVPFILSSSVKYYAFAYAYNDTRAKIYCISNYSVGQTDIRFGYIDFENNVLLDADGVTVISNLGAGNEPVEYTNLSIIVSKGDTILQLVDAYNGTDNSFVYAKFNTASASSQTKNYYCVYENGTWVSYLFDYNLGTNPVNGMVNPLVKVDATKFVAVRHLDNGWVMELYSFENGNFQFVKELVVSNNNDIPLMRPKVVDGIVVYLRGIFTNYLNFNVDTCFTRW